MNVFDKLREAQLEVDAIVASVEIPTHRLETRERGKPENLAEAYYVSQGYDVYRSRVVNGYRCIGAEYYWTKYINRLTDADLAFIAKMKTILSPSELRDFAYAVKVKNGTPDLLLIRDGFFSFVEVKAKNERIKHPTVEFYLKYRYFYDISILRVS